MQIDKVVNLKANYIVTKCDAKTLATFVAKYLGIALVPDYIEKILMNLKKYEKTICDMTKDTVFAKKYLSQYQFETHNVVPLVLRKSLALLISGSSVTPSFQANIIALWNSAVAVNENDVQLWNETKRAIFTNRYAVDNIAYLDKFFAPTEVQWNTYLEAWIFVDGIESTPNSWYLLSHINMDETLGANETLTVNVTITIV